MHGWRGKILRVDLTAGQVTDQPLDEKMARNFIGGRGFGIFTIGGVSLLMAMSAETQAGSYLALWSVVQLVARGTGIAAGGLMRDAALAVTGQFNTAYAVVFVIEALGVLASIPLLRQVDIAGFAASHASSRSAEILSAATE